MVVGVRETWGIRDYGRYGGVGNMITVRTRHVKIPNQSVVSREAPGKRRIFIHVLKDE